MTRKQLFKVWHPAWIGCVALALLGKVPIVRAEGPTLVLRLTGGGTAAYPVSEVQRIGFVGDTLLVVQGVGSDRYSADTIMRVDFLMESSGITDPRDVASLVKAVHLFQNQPNPFSPETRIAFDLPTAGPVELTIYSVNGRVIRRLLKDARDIGPQSVRWDGRDDAGLKVGSGTYFYKLVAPGVDESRRMILLP